MSEKNVKVGIQIDTKVKNLNDLNKLIDELEKSGKNVDDLRKRSKSLADNWDNLDIKQQAQQFRRLKERTAKLASTTDKLGKSAKKAGNGLKRLRNESNLLTKSQDKLRGKMAAAGAAIATYFSVKGITNFFSSSVSGASSLEAQLDKVKAVSGATDSQMKAIAQSAEQLGSSTKYTATQAAQGFEILARAGLNAEQSLTAIPSVLNLAQAAGVELADAAGFITKTISGMNMSMSESGHVADVLAKAAASANTDVAGLGQALSYAAPTANSLGVSLEDTVAIIGKFADSGIDASRAGTALNSIMAQFSDPASKFRKELSAIGINTDDFSEALRQLEKSGDKGAAAINAVGLEAGPALKALLAQGMVSVDALSGKLKIADGFAKQTAKTMSDNLQGAFRGLSSAWDSLKNALGKPLLEPIKDKVNELANVIRDFVSSGKVEAMGRAVAEQFNQMATAFIDFIKDFKLGEVTQSVDEFTQSITDKFSTVNNTFSLVYNTFATGVNVLKTGVYAIGNAFSQVLAGLTSFIPGLGDVSDKLQEFADYTAEQVVKSSEDVFNSAQKTRDAFVALNAETDNHTQAVNQQTQAIKAQVEENKKAVDSFNEKSQKLSELKQLEAEMVKAGKQNTQAYNELVKRRINLETKLAETVKGKVLQAYEKVRKVTLAPYNEMSKGANIAAASIRFLGLTVSELETGISDMAQKTIDNFGVAATQFGSDANKMQKMFTAAMSKMNSPEEFNALKAKLIEVATAAKLPAKEIEKMVKQATDAANKATPAFNNLSMAIQKATNPAQLQQYATQAEQAFKKGEMSAEQYKQTLDDIASKSKEIAVKSAQESAKARQAKQAETEAANASAEAVNADTEAKEENAEATDKAASSGSAMAAIFQDTVNGLSESAQAAKHYKDIMSKFVIGGMDDWINTHNAALGGAKKILEDYRQKTKDVGDAIAEMNQKASDGTLTHEDLNDVISRSKAGYIELDEATLDRVNAEVDKARQKLQSLEDQAKKTAQSIHDRLLNATGSEEDKINLKYQREKEQIKEKDGGANRPEYQQALDDLEKLRQIEINKLKERKAKEQKRQQEREQRQQSRRETQRSNSVDKKQLADEFNRSFTDSVNQADLSGFIQQLGENAGKQLINKMTEEAKRRAN